MAKKRYRGNIPKKGPGARWGISNGPKYKPPPAQAPVSAPPPAPPITQPPADVRDSAYWMQVNQNQADRTATQARYGNPAAADFQGKYGQEGQRLAQQYGFNGFENDPFTLAKQMEQSYQDSRTGTTNNLAAQGQLYSGHMGMVQARNEQNFQQGQHNLESDYQKGLLGITDHATSALSALSRGDIDAFTSALDRSLARTPEDVAGPDEPTQDMKDRYTAAANAPRIAEVRKALMAHGDNWSQRPRLLAELKRLRG